MSFSTLLRTLATFLFLLSASAKFVGSDHKINSGQLSLAEVQDLYSDRINPVKRRVSLRATVADANSQSRQKRDTLLNLYRQKQLYKNLNRNLYQSYFMSPDSRSAASANAAPSSTSSSSPSSPLFKKVVTNPYRDYQKSKSSNNLRPVYKKHHGFHVTDSVNHLKYLVPKPEPSSTLVKTIDENSAVIRPDSSNAQPEPLPLENDISSHQFHHSRPGTSQDATFDEETSGKLSRASAQSTRMRRGDFHSGKPNKDASRAFLDRLRAQSLRPHRTRNSPA